MSSLRPTPDPYRTLGVPRGADQAQIKAAHRRLAKRHHPDAGAEDERRFLAVQEAYRLLSDPLRRREWDRQHSPGPVDARDRGGRGRQRPPAAHWTREDTAAYRRGRGTRRGPSTPPGPHAGAGGSGAGARSHTWSAEGVPWWEDFSPRRPAGGATAGASDEGATAPGGPAPGAPSAARRQGPDADVFNRSSGAAWSSAARRHFRRDAADLPSRGAFRYRGSQVVTGAEARKVAAEEAAAGRPQAHRDLFGRSATTPPARRQAFDHEPVPAAGPETHATRSDAASIPTAAADRAPGPTPARAAAPASTRRDGSRATRLGAIAGAAAAGVPAGLAGLGMTADGGPGLVLLPLVLAATLGGAAAGYLMARRSRQG